MARTIKDFIPDSEWEASPFAYWIFEDVDFIADYDLESWLQAGTQAVSDRQNSDQLFIRGLPENGKGKSDI